MYFPDLTPYEYGGTEPQANVLNVGWLSAAYPVSSGAPDERLIAALQRLAASPVNLYRGSHLCEFCPRPPDDPISWRNPDARSVARNDRERRDPQ
jgi:hypothetical protein